MSKTKDLIKTLMQEAKEREEIAGQKPNTRYSESLETTLATTLLNDIDYERTIYQENPDIIEKNPETIVDKPVEEFRKSLIPTLKKLGLDEDDINKALKEMKFDKSSGKSFAELAKTFITEYISTGRKMKFPITEPNWGEFSIALRDVEETSVETNKPEKQDDGSFKMVPTGKKVTKLGHLKMVCSTSLPPWLVESEDL